MTKIYSFTVSVEADIVDAFCLMQKGFTDQFAGPLRGAAVA